MSLMGDFGAFRWNAPYGYGMVDFGAFRWNAPYG